MKIPVILSHPVNVFVILAMIGLFWFACFKLSQAGILPADADAD